MNVNHVAAALHFIPTHSTGGTGIVLNYNVQNTTQFHYTGVGQTHSLGTMQSSSTSDQMGWKLRKDKQV